MATPIASLVNQLAQREYVLTWEGLYMILDYVSDLRNINGPPNTNAQSMYVRNHSFAGDGGGGIFVWDPTSEAADDNGITLLPTGRLTAGRWRRADAAAGVINCLWFGCGENSTNVSTQMQQALTAAAGKILYIPPNPLRADYRCSSLVVYSQTRIICAPSARMYGRFSGGAYQPWFDTTAQTDSVTIEGGEWWNCNPVWRHSSTSNTLVNTTIGGHMDVRPPAGGKGFEFTRCVNITFDTVYITGGAYGIHLATTTAGHHATMITLRGSRILNTTTAGLYTDDTARQRSTFNITDSSFELNDGPAIVAGGNLESFNVVGNYLEYNGQVTNDPDIIISGTNSVARTVDVSYNFFGPIGGSQLHRVRVNDDVSVFMDRNTVTLAEGVKFALLANTDAGERKACARFDGNHLLDSYALTQAYRTLLYELSGVGEERVSVFENLYSPQYKSGDPFVPLGVVTANSVSVASYRHASADYGGATTINTFADGAVGQELTVRFTTANTTIAHAVDNIRNNTSANKTPAAGSVLRWVFDGTNWVEL